MPTLDLVVEGTPSRSVKARQVEALFDVPAQERQRLEWRGSVPIEDRDWSVGLIVGPSGCGKSTVARRLFGESYHPALTWGGASVIDDCVGSVADIAACFSAVGFGTVPAWLRPYEVLSNGERFRVDVARRLLELESPIVVDEFTSVVDRQVAKVGAHAIQKRVRQLGKKFVAVTCHHDVEDWLQPDWVLEPAGMAFRWRLPQRRPPIEVTIRRVEHRAWELFAPYHYLTADLHKGAACFCAFVGEQPVAFAGVLHFPHPKVRDIVRLSRLVTLPDWQGLGLAFVLTDALASHYADVDKRFRTYPAHPSLVRAFDRSSKWQIRKEPGSFSSGNQRRTRAGERAFTGAMGGRPCAVFEWVGGAFGDRAFSANLLAG